MHVARHIISVGLLLIDTEVSSCAQVADFLFGAQAGQYDYLQETLLRLLAVGWLGAAVQNLVNKVMQ